MNTKWDPTGPEVMIGRHSVQVETIQGANSTTLKIAAFDLVHAALTLSIEKTLIHHY